ncbi:MAG: ArsR/SmtB family transcription factor [Oliverpabstia sp.]
MSSAYSDTVKVFKAFCDENRLKILEQLRTGEKCACKLLDELHITQPTLSHHMKLLCDADIVQGRKEGKWVHYSINPEGAKRAQKILTHFVTLDNTNEQDENFCGE